MAYVDKLKIDNNSYDIKDTKDALKQLRRLIKALLATSIRLSLVL